MVRAPKPSAHMGIDPGAHGGIVIKAPDTIILHSLTVSERDNWRFIEDWSRRYDLVCCIEQIQPAIHGIGKTQMSKLYGSYRELRMALVAAEIPFIDVPPKKWQRFFNIPGKKGRTSAQHKEVLRALAQRLFPHLPLWNIPKTLGKQREIADALLLSQYCQSIWHVGND